MSRIGKLPVVIPAGEVEAVKTSDQRQGALGIWRCAINPLVKVEARTVRCSFSRAIAREAMPCMAPRVSW
jgi:hypothetical protein